MMKKSKTPQQAIVQLEALCARAEHCTSEMRRKLYDWGINRDDAEKIVSHLIRNRYVDDCRFARAYVKDKLIFGKWGRNKIKQGLIAKRITSEIIVDALDEIDEQQYMEILEHILNVKINSISDTDAYTRKMKLLRFAVSRGFEAGLVVELLNAGDLCQTDD